MFAPLPPDPAPPGAAKFSEDAFAKWKADHGADVTYELLAWPQLHDRMATAFASGSAPWDICYMCGWVPEFQSFLTPFADKLPKELVDDLPTSSFSTVTVGGKRYGAVFTLSLLTLFYNKEHLEQAGFKAPPKNWDELKRLRQGADPRRPLWLRAQLRRPGRHRRHGELLDGLPAAGRRQDVWRGRDARLQRATPGVDALQLMVDLMPLDRSRLDLLCRHQRRHQRASRRPRLDDDELAVHVERRPGSRSSRKIVGKLAAPCCRPARRAPPRSTAPTPGPSPRLSKNPDKARELIEFYLDADVQKRQVLDTGWLPIRLSVLADPEVQAKAPNAAVVLEQAKHPYDSFVTPDYNEVTVAVGTEVQKALQGQKTAAQAIADAQDRVAGIVKRRG